MEIKILGETYIRNTNSCPCKNDNEICNFCKWMLKDKSNHVHLFFFIKILTKKNWLRRIFNKELKTYMYKCPCGEIVQYGRSKIELSSDWDMRYA